MTAPLETQGRRPVFLHGLWRSGSTYLWSRFRAAEGTCCFYEPLHHGLSRLTLDRIRREAPDLAAANGHPVLASPYFEEFAPLIRRRGVRGYRTSFAYHRFALAADETNEPLRRYVGGLIAHADGMGRQAVLGFNRAGLRIAWLKANFSAYDIHIDRDPAAVWASYEAQRARGNLAFYMMWLRVLDANADSPLWASLIDRLNLGSAAARLGLPSRLGLSSKRRHRAQIERMGAEQRYFLVFYAWLALIHHAVEHCDLVIDTQLSEATDYAAAVSAEIRRATGTAVDLSGLRAPSLDEAPPAPWGRAEVEREALALFARVERPSHRAAPAEKLAQLSPRKAEMLAAVV